MTELKTLFKLSEHIVGALLLKGSEVHSVVTSLNNGGSGEGIVSAVHRPSNLIT